jgi:iron complex transport system permease protein
LTADVASDARSSTNSRAKRWHLPRFAYLGLLALAVVVLSAFLGRYPAPYLTAPATLWDDDLARRLVVNLRIPRIIAAFLTGAVLSAAGNALQMVFRNPLVDAGFLGVSQGAAFGACLAIVVLGGSPLLIQGCAAGFAFLGLALTYAFGQRIRFGDWVLRLVLAGIAVSAFFSSGVGVLKAMADPTRQLPDLTFWLLGGLWATTWPDVLQILPIVLPCLLTLHLLRWRLNLLSLRDETALSLGTSPARERAVVLVAAVAATAVTVAKAGIVGWVGLIVPHIARRLLGADAQISLPGSMLIGGVFVLICDDVARTALAGEIPLGILTSLVGALLFVGLMLRGDVAVRR